MTIFGFVLKETARIILKKDYAEHSDRSVPKAKKKSLLKCFIDIVHLFRYWNAFPDTYFRFGSKGCFVDNLSKGGIAVSLDVETGRLQSFGMREYDITHYTEHPDSHISFDNTVVMQWPSVRSVVEKTLEFFPFYRSVGFDVATTIDGPVIIEINTGAGIYLSQMGKHYALRDKFIR